MSAGAVITLALVLPSIAIAFAVLGHALEQRMRAQVVAAAATLEPCDCPACANLAQRRAGAVSQRIRTLIELRLWTINRWLRWTGVRLFLRVGVPNGPSHIGLCWYGWGFVGHEPAAGRWP